MGNLRQKLTPGGNAGYNQHRPLRWEGEKSYLQKAEVRSKVIELLIEEKAYSDVIREAQEAVELALKGILRQIGVEPPKVHDVGGLICEYREKLPVKVAAQAEALAAVSKWLRKEREFAFYGDVDFIPTLEYSLQDAAKAREDLKLVLNAARQVIKK